MTRRDRRLLVTKLAEDVPAGPQGQPAHKAGSDLVHITAAKVEGVGGVSFATPRPSELLLHEAKATLARAARLRKQCLSQTRRRKWTQPGIDLRITNDQLVFDFFGTAMSGIVQTYTAIDARLNEFFTRPVTHKGQEIPVDQVQGYWSVERKMDYLVANSGLTWLDESSLRSDVRELKELRDMVIHIRSEHIRGGHPEFIRDGGSSLLWTRLLNEQDLERFGRLAERVLEGLRSRRPDGIDKSEGT
jgi:hypothetical protein